MSSWIDKDLLAQADSDEFGDEANSIINRVTSAGQQAAQTVSASVPDFHSMVKGLTSIWDDPTDQQQTPSVTPTPQPTSSQSGLTAPWNPPAAIPAASAPTSPVAMPTAPAPVSQTSPYSVSYGSGADPSSMSDEAWARSEAQRLGIDPQKAVDVGNTEGGFTEPGIQNREGAPAYSPYQLYIGGPSNPGLGDEALAAGIDARDPRQSKAAITYALEHAAKNGWHAFQGAAAHGIGDWEGIGQAPANPASQTVTTQAQPYSKNAISATTDLSEPAQAALDDPDKWALCGPVAAVIAALNHGKDWTVDQAKKIAVANGLWDPDNGMHGLGSTVNLLSQMGIDATTGDASEQHLAADAQNGNTPIISTNKHYFILKGYNPQTRQFDTSTTGTVYRGGSRWMTLDEIDHLGGGIQGAAYIDNPSSPHPSSVATATSPPAAMPQGQPSSPGNTPANQPAVSTQQQQTTQGQDARDRLTAPWSSTPVDERPGHFTPERSIITTPVSDASAPWGALPSSTTPPDPSFPDPEASRNETVPGLHTPQDVSPDRQSGYGVWKGMIDTRNDVVPSNQPADTYHDPATEMLRQPLSATAGPDTFPTNQQPPASQVQPDENPPPGYADTRGSDYQITPGQPIRPPQEPTSGQQIINSITNTIRGAGEAGRRIADAIDQATNTRGGPMSAPDPATGELHPIPGQVDAGTFDPRQIQGALFALPHDLYQRALDEMGINEDVGRNVSGTDPLAGPRRVAQLVTGRDPFPSAKTLNPENRPAMTVLGTAIAAPFMPGSEALGMAAPPEMTLGFLGAGGIIRQLPGAGRFLLGRLTSFIEGRQPLEGFQVVENGAVRPATRADLRAAYDGNRNVTPGLVPANGVTAAAEAEARNAHSVIQGLVDSGQISQDDGQRLAAAAARSYLDTASQDLVSASRDASLPEDQRGAALQQSVMARRARAAWDSRLQDLGAPSLHAPSPDATGADTSGSTYVGDQGGGTQDAQLRGAPRGWQRATVGGGEDVPPGAGQQGLAVPDNGEPARPTFQEIKRPGDSGWAVMRTEPSGQASLVSTHLTRSEARDRAAFETTQSAYKPVDRGAHGGNLPPAEMAPEDLLGGYDRQAAAEAAKQPGPGLFDEPAQHDITQDPSYPDLRKTLLALESNAPNQRSVSVESPVYKSLDGLKAVAEHLGRTVEVVPNPTQPDKYATINVTQKAPAAPPAQQTPASLPNTEAAKAAGGQRIAEPFTLGKEGRQYTVTQHGVLQAVDNGGLKGLPVARYQDGEWRRVHDNQPLSETPIGSDLPRIEQARQEVMSGGGSVAKPAASISVPTGRLISQIDAEARARHDAETAHLSDKELARRQWQGYDDKELAQALKAAQSTLDAGYVRGAERRGVKAKVEAIQTEQVARKGEQPSPAKPVVDQSARTAKMLRDAADRLESQIQEKLNPPISHQTMTDRRARIADGMADQGRALQQTQHVMRQMADAHEAGTLPEALKGVRSRADVEALLRARSDTMPQPAVNRYAARDLLEKTKGKRGLAEPRRTIERALSRVPDSEHMAPLLDSEVAAHETLWKAAEMPSFMHDGTADYRRAKKMGIAEPGRYKQAVQAIKEYTREETPAERQAKRVADLERQQIGNKDGDFFPTPKNVAERMVKAADIRPGMSVLEPSAGTGHIAEAVREHAPDANLTAIERSSGRREILQAKGFNVAGESDFLQHQGKYDRIVMNPPFSKNQDIAHVRHAYDLLKPGGKVSAIMSEHAFFSDDKPSRDFRDWLAEQGGSSEKLPAGTFNQAGLTNTTGVAARLVTVEKPAGAVAPIEAADRFAKGVERGKLHEAPEGPATWPHLPKGMKEPVTPISAGIGSGYSVDDVMHFYAHRRGYGRPGMREQALKLGRQEFEADLQDEPQAVRSIIQDQLSAKPQPESSNPWEPDAYDRAENARMDAEISKRPPHGGYLAEDENIDEGSVWRSAGGAWHVEAGPQGMSVPGAFETRDVAQAALNRWHREQAAKAAPSRTEVEPTQRSLTGPVGSKTFALGIYDRTKKYPMRWRAVPLDDLVTSHSHTSLAPNPDFPQELQPRARETAATRQWLETESTPERFSPTSLLTDTHELGGSAPIIGPDGLVESGNGRTMLLKHVRDTRPDVFAGYQRDLPAAAEKVGIKRSELAGIKDPVLVRENLTPFGEGQRAEFTKEANTDDKLELSAGEKARADARLVDAEDLAALAVPADGDIRKAVTSAENAEWVRKIVGRMPPGERGGMITGKSGRLSDKGAQRIRNAIFARVFGGEAGLQIQANYMDAATPEEKAIGHAISGALVDLAKLEGSVADGQTDKGLAIAEPLAEAVLLRTEAKATKQKLSELVASRQALPGMGDPADEITQALALWIDKNVKRPALLRETLQEYARTALREPPPGQTSMFGEAGPRSAVEVWDAALRAVEENRGLAPTWRGSAPAEQRPAPQAASGSEQTAPARAQKPPAASAAKPASAPERTPAAAGADVRPAEDRGASAVEASALPDRAGDVEPASPQGSAGRSAVQPVTGPTAGPVVPPAENTAAQPPAPSADTGRDLMVPEAAPPASPPPVEPPAPPSEPPGAGGIEPPSNQGPRDVHTVGAGYWSTTLPDEAVGRFQKMLDEWAQYSRSGGVKQGEVFEMARALGVDDGWLSNVIKRALGTDTKMPAVESEALKTATLRAFADVENLQSQLTDLQAERARRGDDATLAEQTAALQQSLKAAQSTLELVGKAERRDVEGHARALAQQQFRIAAGAGAEIVSRLTANVDALAKMAEMLKTMSGKTKLTEEDLGVLRQLERLLDESGVLLAGRDDQVSRILDAIKRALGEQSQKPKAPTRTQRRVITGKSEDLAAEVKRQRQRLGESEKKASPADKKEAKERVDLARQIVDVDRQLRRTPASQQPPLIAQRAALARRLEDLLVKQVQDAAESEGKSLSPEQVDEQIRNRAASRMSSQMLNQIIGPKPGDPNEIAATAERIKDEIIDALRQENVLEQTPKSLGELSQELVRLNREQAKLRDQDSAEAAAALEPQRQDLLGRMNDLLRAQVLRQMEKTRAGATMLDVDKALARGELAKIRRAIEEQQRFPDAAMERLYDKMERERKRALERDDVNAVLDRIRQIHDTGRRTFRAADIKQDLLDMQPHLEALGAAGRARADALREGLFKATLMRGNKDEERFKNLTAAQKLVDPSNPQQVGGFLKALREPGWLDHAQEAMVVNMLTSPLTWSLVGQNFTSNALQIGVRNLSVLGAHGYGEWKYLNAGMGAAAPEAYARALEIMRQGYLTDDVERAMMTGDWAQTRPELMGSVPYTGRAYRGGTIAKVGVGDRALNVTIPGLYHISTRPLNAMDVMQGHMLYAGTVAQLAYRKAGEMLAASKGGVRVPSGFGPEEVVYRATPDGTSGYIAKATKTLITDRDELTHHILRNLHKPEYSGIKDEAGAIEDYYLLRKPLNRKGDNSAEGMVDRAFQRFVALRHAERSAPLGVKTLAMGAHLMLPFFNTSYNATKQMLSLSPPGIGYNAYRAATAPTKQDRAEAVLKAALGVGLMALSYYLQSQDLLTGDGPDDAGDNARWRRTHEPHSLFVAGKWRRLDGTVIGMPLIATANALEDAKAALAKTGRKPEEAMGDAALAFGGGLIKGTAAAIFGQSSLRAASDMGNLFQGRTTAAAMGANYASRIMPATSMLRWLANMGDPVMRDPKSFTDFINVALPRGRSQVQTKLNEWGEAIPNPRYGLAASLDPFRSVRPWGLDDPIIKKLDESSVTVPTAPGTVRNVPLTDDERRAFTLEAGPIIKQQLGAFVLSPGFEAMPISERQKAVNFIIDPIRKSVGDEILTKMGNEEIARRLAEQTRTPLPNPERKAS